MSPKKSRLTVGLIALGWFGYAAARAASPGVPPAPSGPPPAPASSSPTHSVLLKTNGDLLVGTIVEESGRFLVQQSGGSIPVARNQVERTFESIQAVYRYKAGRIPENDPDEHLKLARWCLGRRLRAEAREQLKFVLAFSPNAREARAMLASVEASAARANPPRVDPALIQTRAEMVVPGEPEGEPRPAEIDAAAFLRARRDLGVSGLPVIFDLPQAVAVKRAESFARNVHPVLLAACAKCHNEQYRGAFQLIEVKTRRGPTPDVLRANLDATLRLVDPESPPRSELLSRSLVPHGNGPSQRPIFRGSNDFRYQIIAAWVNSLRANRPPDAAASARVTPRGEAPGGDGFAAERVPGQSASSEAGPAITPNLPKPYAAFPPPESVPATRYVPGQGMVTERVPPTPAEFPLSPLLGGPKPRPTAPPAGTPTASGPGSAIPMPSPPTSAASPDPTLPPLPADGTSPPKTPVKLDMDLLQKTLMNRNMSR